MSTLYKLTEQDNTTYKQSMLWGENISNSVLPCINPQLCTSEVIHAYRSIELALLLNPAQADIIFPTIWLARGDVVVEDWGKVGCFELTTVKRLIPPSWFVDESTHAKIAVQFAILCAQAVIHIWEQYSNNTTPQLAIQVAQNYLNNDGAANAAYAAAANVVNAAAYAARATAYAAAHAARAAAHAEVDFNSLAKQAVTMITG